MEFEKTDAKRDLKALVHGPSGNGKTVFASTADGLGKVVLANLEAGTLSIADKIESGSVQSVRIQTHDELKAFCLEIKSTNHGFETLVVDSLTEAQKIIMESILASQKKKEIPALQDWMKLSEETRKMVRFFRDLPLNVILVCLSKDEKDEQFGSIVRKPSLSGKLPEEVSGYMDLVLYIATKEVEGNIERFAVTQPTERLYAKDRSGKLERYEVPNFTAIHQKVFGNTKGGKGK